MKRYRAAVKDPVTKYALPLPDDEERRRADEAIQALDSLADMDDDAEQSETFAALVQAIDRDRMSDRRRFSQ